VIGDVHGCAAELEMLLAELPLTSDATVVFLGDYIDRGNRSRQVIEAILALRQRHHVVALLGNHEAMFLDFWTNPRSEDGGMFIYNGGGSTLASYADAFGRYTIPEEHLAFLRSLPPWHETPEAICVHAGLPQVPLDQLDPVRDREDILWSRCMQATAYRWSKVVVHGHDPVTQVDFRPHAINVDTGCVFGRSLSAVELPSGRTFSVPLQSSEPPQYLRDIRSSRQAVRFEGSLPVTVYADGCRIHFLTVNYSEIGMLLRCLSLNTPVRFQAGESVSGTIGARPWHVRFAGQIVRADEQEDGVYYAVKIVGLDAG
jgi:serine/threonine protein phosphatase 1